MKPGYSMMPYKVVWCTKEDCDTHPTIPIRDLPRNPWPGRMPKGCTHVHIVAGSGRVDRSSSDIREWKRIALSTMRCEHGRQTGQSCNKEGCMVVVDRSGVRIGTLSHVHGLVPVVTPDNEDKDDPYAWFERE